MMYKLATTSGSLVLLTAFCTQTMAGDKPKHRSGHRDSAAITIGSVLSLIADHHDSRSYRGPDHRGHDYRGHEGWGHDRERLVDLRGHGVRGVDGNHHDDGHDDGRFDDGRHHSRGGFFPGNHYRGRQYGNGGIQFQLTLGGGSRFASPGPAPGAFVPAPQPAMFPVPSGAPTIGGYCVGCVVQEPVPLYQHVRVNDPQNIAPHSVRRIIAVRDPRGCDHLCECCPQQCVFVEVCMPACECHDIEVSRDGRRIKYDFGDYEIEITSRHGVVTVDYDD